MQTDAKSSGRLMLTAAGAVTSIAVLMLALQLLKIFAAQENFESLNYSTIYSVAATLLFFMSAAELIAWLSNRGERRFSDFRRLLGVGVYLVCGVLMILQRGDDFITAAACLGYAPMLILGRVDAVLRDRRARSFVSNGISVLLIILFLGTAVRLIFFPLFLIVQSLAQIASVAFSRINFRTLRKIIRKTYTVEIIFGMLLLMVAFSVLLTSIEKGMETFGDAMWYCFALVTTIGFGDISATTIIGRILSVILGAYGIIVVSLITSVIVNFYNEVKNEPDEDPSRDVQTGKEITDHHENE